MQLMKSHRNINSCVFLRQKIKEMDSHQKSAFASLYHSQGRKGGGIRKLVILDLNIKPVSITGIEQF